MRVLIVTEAIGKNFYGVEQVIVDLVKRLILFGFQFRILVSNIGDVSEITADVERIPSDAVENRFRWHPGMRDFFIQEIAEFHPDIVHVHGVFTFVQRTAVEVARAMNIPTLWSTHGGLEAWVWRQNSLFHRLGRRLYWRFVLSPSYKKVNAVHVITDLESRTLAGYFPNLPQVEIPNGIDLSIIPYIPAQLPEKKFVFLGRLHPVKGVDLLLKAFSRICLDDCQLIIAGP